MPDAISNTSPLLYLHRIDALSWLPSRERFDYTEWREKQWIGETVSTLVEYARRLRREHNLEFQSSDLDVKGSSWGNILNYYKLE